MRTLVLWEEKSMPAQSPRALRIGSLTSNGLTKGPSSLNWTQLAWEKDSTHQQAALRNHLLKSIFKTLNQTKACNWAVISADLMCGAHPSSRLTSVSRLNHTSLPPALPTKRLVASIPLFCKVQEHKAAVLREGSGDGASTIKGVQMRFLPEHHTKKVLQSLLCFKKKLAFAVMRD
eukprot:161125-Pelagomonas_calceolata.AAC.1